MHTNILSILIILVGVFFFSFSSFAEKNNTQKKIELQGKLAKPVARSIQIVIDPIEIEANEEVEFNEDDLDFTDPFFENFQEEEFLTF